MSRVLVTGGPGFIGRRVVQRFLDAGWDVTSFSLPGEQPIASWSGPVRMVHGDLGIASAVAEAAEGCDLVIHLAAPVGVAGRYQWQWDVIAEGTRNVCEAIAAQGGRAVVASSIAVYGTLIQTQICHEDDGHGPWTGAYGRGKQGQETVALETAVRTGMPLTLIRPANVYGLGGASAWGTGCSPPLPPAAGQCLVMQTRMMRVLSMSKILPMHYILQVQVRRPLGGRTMSATKAV